MTIWRLRVDGTPAPKGSMTCIGQRGKTRHQVIESDPGGVKKVWRDRLTAAAAELADRLPNAGDDGVIVGLLVLLQRPTAAKNRRLPLLKNTGDVDKHLRQVCDALTDGGTYIDDSRVALAITGKAYADDSRPGAVIYVAPIGEDPRRILNAMETAAPALFTPTLLQD